MGGAVGRANAALEGQIAELQDGWGAAPVRPSRSQEEGSLRILTAPESSRNERSEGDVSKLNLRGLIELPSGIAFEAQTRTYYGFH